MEHVAIYAAKLFVSWGSILRGLTYSFLYKAGYLFGKLRVEHVSGLGEPLVTMVLLWMWIKRCFVCLGPRATAIPACGPSFGMLLPFWVLYFKAFPRVPTNVYKNRCGFQYFPRRFWWNVGYHSIYAFRFKYNSSHQPPTRFHFQILTPGFKVSCMKN